MHVEILNPEGAMESVNWSVGNGSPVERKEVVSVDFRLLDYFVIKEAVPATDESEALDAIQGPAPLMFRSLLCPCDLHGNLSKCLEPGVFAGAVALFELKPTAHLAAADRHG